MSDYLCARLHGRKRTHSRKRLPGHDAANRFIALTFFPNGAELGFSARQRRRHAPQTQVLGPSVSARRHDRHFQPAQCPDIADARRLRLDSKRTCDFEICQSCEMPQPQDLPIGRTQPRQRIPKLCRKFQSFDQLLRGVRTVDDRRRLARPARLRTGGWLTLASRVALPSRQVAAVRVGRRLNNDESQPDIERLRSVAVEILAALRRLHEGLLQDVVRIDTPPQSRIQTRGDQSTQCRAVLIEGSCKSAAISASDASPWALSGIHCDSVPPPKQRINQAPLRCAFRSPLR